MSDETARGTHRFGNPHTMGYHERGEALPALRVGALVEMYGQIHVYNGPHDWELVMPNTVHVFGIDGEHMDDDEVKAQQFRYRTADVVDSPEHYAPTMAHYAALDAVVAQITAKLGGATPEGTNYEAGGHTAYGLWLVRESDSFPTGGLLTVILSEALEDCEFFVQSFGQVTSLVFDGLDGLVQA